MNNIQSILSARQIAKFILWIDHNPVCMQMLEALWPHITLSSSSSMSMQSRNTSVENLDLFSQSQQNHNHHQQQQQQKQGGIHSTASSSSSSSSRTAGMKKRNEEEYSEDDDDDDDDDDD